MAAACNVVEDQATSTLNDDFLEAQIVAQAITELQEIQAPVIQVSQQSDDGVAMATEGTQMEGGQLDDGMAQTHVIYYIEDGSIARAEDRTLVDSAVQANDYEIERRSGRVPARRRVIPVKFRDYKNTSDNESSDSDYEPPEQKPKVRRVAQRNPRPKQSITSDGQQVIPSKQGRVGRPRKNYMPPQPGGEAITHGVSSEIEEKYKQAIRMSEGIQSTGKVTNSTTTVGQFEHVEEEKGEVEVEEAGKTDEARIDQLKSEVKEDAENDSVAEDGEKDTESNIDNQTVEESTDPTGSEESMLDMSSLPARRCRGRPRGPSWERFYKCPDCEKVFNQKGNLKVHLRVHTSDKPYMCLEEGCGKSFRSNESLRRHLMSHKGIKPFACDICNNKFSSNVALVEHRSRHFNEKPYECPHCQKRFRQVSCLRRHVMTHSKDMPYICKVCHRGFSQTAYLKSHMKVHTGEKPFKCDTCGKRFAHQSDVKRHRTTHTGEKPYACSKCSAKFSDVSSKNRHEKEHENNKRYVCHICNDTFKRTGQLRSHLNRKHSHSFAIKIDKDPSSGAFTFRMGDHEPGSFQVTQQRIVSLIKNLHTKTVTDGFTEIDNIPVMSMPNIGKQTEVVTVTSDQMTDISQLEKEVDPSVIECDIGVPVELQGVEIQGEENGQTYIAISDLPEHWEGAEKGDGQVECRYRIVYEIAEDGTQKQILVPHIPGEEEGTNQIQYEELSQDGSASTVQIISEESEVSVATESIVEEQVTANLVEPESIGDDIMTSTSDPEVSETIIENDGSVSCYEAASEDLPMTSTSKEAMSVNTETESTVDYVSSPDFSSQEYYNWLTNFTELCKVVPMPLDMSLFQKISQVHKTLSDVMATPSGVIADRENFRVLMNISKELSAIINEHLVYVLENLKPDEKAKELAGMPV